MKMKQYQAMLLITAAAYLFGCDEKNDDLLVDYQSHALEAKTDVGKFESGEMNARTMMTMQTHVGDHLKKMHTIRMKMMSLCRQDETCPNGWGATGKMDGSHMNGEQYLDSDHMSEMAERENAAKEAMDSMHETCDTRLENVETCWRRYSGEMKNTFDEMADACADMMSGHMGASGMMGVGSGMMENSAM